MTTLAEHRATHRQHARMVGAVRIVAVATVLSNRGVLPEIRATLLGMTSKTGVVQRLPRKLPFARRTMSVVATAAIHLALPDRVREGLQRLRALLLMAIEANFGLCHGRQHRIRGRVGRVTVGTGHAVVIMVVAVPAEPGVTRMTVQA